jgi:hypothetical protein
MKNFLLSLSAICLCGFGIYSCGESNWYKTQERERDAREAAERTPHVIREADGCKVYAFKAGDATHFFTRCGDKVTTDRNYTTNCGKSCTKHLTETIVTDANK